MGQVPAGINGERRNVGRPLSASEAQLKCSSTSTMSVTDVWGPPEGRNRR
jgi:hypothetical protein